MSRENVEVVANVYEAIARRDNAPRLTGPSHAWLRRRKSVRAASLRDSCATVGIVTVPPLAPHIGLDCA